MAAEMPMGLLREWMAYAKMNPLALSPSYAQLRQDWNAAMIAATTYGAISATWKRPPKRLIQDFMFRERGERKQQQTAGELFKMFKSAVGANKPH